MTTKPDDKLFGKDKSSCPEFLADSAKQIRESIEVAGLRDKLDRAFQSAIARARGLKRKTRHLDSRS